MQFVVVCSMIATVDGPLVKRLRRCPLTAETGVRFPYGLLYLFKNFFKKGQETFLQTVDKVVLGLLSWHHQTVDKVVLGLLS